MPVQQPSHSCTIRRSTATSNFQCEPTKGATSNGGVNRAFAPPFPLLFWVELCESQDARQGLAHYLPFQELWAETNAVGDGHLQHLVAVPPQARSSLPPDCRRRAQEHSPRPEMTRDSSPGEIISVWETSTTQRDCARSHHMDTSSVLEETPHTVTQETVLFQHGPSLSSPPSPLPHSSARLKK